MSEKPVPLSHILIGGPLAGAFLVILVIGLQ